MLGSRGLRLWQVLLPVSAAAIPLLHRYYSPNRIRFPKLRAKLARYSSAWRSGRLFRRLDQSLADYSVGVAERTCKDERVSEAFSELLEEAIGAPGVSAAILKKFDEVLATEAMREKVLGFLTHLIRSEEVKSALQDQAADPEIQERLSDLMVTSLKRLFPWSRSSAR